MPKGHWDSKTYHMVTLTLYWPMDKFDRIAELARANKCTLDEMVELILDDWAARANHALGDKSIPLVLETPAERKARAE